MQVPYVNLDHVKVLPNGSLQKRDEKPGEAEEMDRRHQACYKVQKTMRRKHN